jgi:hypothetical protein
MLLASSRIFVSMMSTTAITLAHLRALVTYVRDIRFQRVCLSGFKAPSDRHPPPNIVDAVITLRVHQSLQSNHYKVDMRKQVQFFAASLAFTISLVSAVVLTSFPNHFPCNCNCCISCPRVKTYRSRQEAVSSISVSCKSSDGAIVVCRFGPVIAWIVDIPV